MAALVRVAPATLVLLANVSAALAQLDPRLEKPYHLRIVVHLADHRIFTPLFRDQVEKDLRDELQLSLGGLARVEVVRSHPLLRDVEVNGLEAPLDAWRELSMVRTHFLLIDFDQGLYRLRSRQHDGGTGLATPVVRRGVTGDRERVVREAARLIELDFGLTGTIVDVGKDIKVAFQGGNLGIDLGQHVKAGDVFAISRIAREGDKERGERVRWAVLEALESPLKGECRCRLWQRYQEDDLRPAPGVIGFRCLKLATVERPLKLRLIDDESDRPHDGVQVHLLKPSGAKLTELTTNRDGLAVARASHGSLIIVRVLSGGELRAQFPVEVVDDRTVTCRLKLRPEAEETAALEFRKELWLRRILEQLKLAADRVTVLNSQLAQSLERALDTARGGLKLMEEEIGQLDQERVLLARLATQKKLPLDLKEGDAGLVALREKRKELEQFAVRVETAQKQSVTEKSAGVHQLLEQARLLETQAEYDKAIAHYTKVLDVSPDQAKVREHLEGLKKAWQTRDPKHADARAFLIVTWPRLEAAELAKHVPLAQAALATCREAGDGLTPRRVLQANLVHAANLKKSVDALKRQDTDDSRTAIKSLAVAADALRRLHAEASALAAKSPP